MTIEKECGECGEVYEVMEEEVEAGNTTKDGEKVWLCFSCRDNDNEEVDP